MITFLRKMPIAEITKVDTEIQNKWTLYKKKKSGPDCFKGISTKLS